MKRKSADTSSDNTCGRRQPQTSCDSCRRKKLKCDRGEPCSNCSVRGLTCGRQSISSIVESEKPRSSLPSITDEPSVLDRLKRLEDAIFGHGAPSPVGKSESSSPNVEIYLGTVSYHVDGVPASNSATRPDPFTSRRGPSFDLRINLMSRDDALIFLHDFVDNPIHLLPLIQETTVRSMIHRLYDNLSTPGAAPTPPAQAALVLSIATTCAALYYDGCKISHMFKGEEDAAEATLAWIKSAMSLLDQSQRTLSYCLEDIQARAIISYVLSNFECCSSRFRSLHSSCVLVAYELGLHLIDRPKAIQTDDHATREIKRRLWWYIVSNDWILGFVGGPPDGTYAIQPRHMNVRHARNINDDDLLTNSEDFEQPKDVPTGMSFLIQRERLAKTCRTALDMRAPEAPDDDVMDIDNSIYLDGLFTKLVEELPTFFQEGATMPFNTPPWLELQRDTILTAIHSRWARIHRCHVLSKHKDPRSQPLRQRSLDSARKAVKIATKMLDPSLPQLGSSVARRTGVVVAHLFTGCTMLAMIASPAAGNEDLATSFEVQDDLRHAYRVLTAAAKSSPVADTLVRELTGILRQYSVQGVADCGQPHNTQSGCKDISFPTLSLLPNSENSGRRSMQTEGTEMDETLLGADGLQQNDLWTELLGTMTSTDGWDDLFTGLDPYCGTA